MASKGRVNLILGCNKIKNDNMVSYVNTKQSNDKLIGLEVIRFISALSVLVWHYQHFFYVADKATDFVREQQPFYEILKYLYVYGYNGVQVFWCISGFIFFWKYRIAISDKVVTYKKFFLLRFSRLYPLHFVTLLIVAFLQIIYYNINKFFFVYQNSNLKHFFLQLLMASNWGFENGFSFNGPIWSISVEVLIYFFFFVVLRYVGRSSLVNIVVLLLCFFAKYIKISTPIVDCLIFFYMGGLSAIAYQYFEKTKLRDLIKSVALGFVIIVPFVAYATNIYQKQYFAYLFLITYTPFLLYVSAQDMAVHSIVRKIIEAAGNMTYSSYLIHFPIQLLIAVYCVVTHQAIPGYNPIFFLVFIFFTLYASYWTYRLFEMPLQLYIRQRFR